MLVVWSVVLLLDTDVVDALEATGVAEVFWGTWSLGIRFPFDADLFLTRLVRFTGLCTCTFLGEGSRLPPELTVDETLKELAPAIRLILGTLLDRFPAH